MRLDPPREDSAETIGATTYLFEKVLRLASIWPVPVGQGATTYLFEKVLRLLPIFVAGYFCRGATTYLFEKVLRRSIFFLVLTMARRNDLPV